MVELKAKCRPHDLTKYEVGCCGYEDDRLTLFLRTLHILYFGGFGGEGVLTQDSAKSTFCATNLDRPIPQQK
jgi:hypothetical protein